MSRQHFVARVTPYEWLALGFIMQTPSWIIDRQLLQDCLRVTVKHERPSEVLRSLMRGGFIDSYDDNKHLTITTDGLRAKRSRRGQNIPWYVSIPPRLVTPIREA